MTIGKQYSNSIEHYRMLHCTQAHARSFSIYSQSALTVRLYSNFNNISYMATTSKGTRLQAKQLSEMSPNGK